MGKVPPKEITYLFDSEINPNDGVIPAPPQVTRELTGKEIISIKFGKIAKIDGKHVAQLNEDTIRFDTFLYAINHDFKGYIPAGTKVIILYKEK